MRKLAPLGPSHDLDVRVHGRAQLQAARSQCSRRLSRADGGGTPELARVGLTELEAQQQAIPYRVATIPMTRVRRTLTLSETRRFLKALISAESDEILGFAAFGAEAGELMAVVQAAMLAKQPYTLLPDAIFSAPDHSRGLDAPIRSGSSSINGDTILAGKEGGKSCCVKSSGCSAGQ